MAEQHSENQIASDTLDSLMGALKSAIHSSTGIIGGLGYTFLSHFSKGVQEKAKSEMAKTAVIVVDKFGNEINDQAKRTGDKLSTSFVDNLFGKLPDKIQRHPFVKATQNFFDTVEKNARSLATTASGKFSSFFDKIATESKAAGLVLAGFGFQLSAIADLQGNLVKTSMQAGGGLWGDSLERLAVTVNSVSVAANLGQDRVVRLLEEFSNLGMVSGRTSGQLVEMMTVSAKLVKEFGYSTSEAARLYTGLSKVGLGWTQIDGLVEMNFESGSKLNLSLDEQKSIMGMLSSHMTMYGLTSVTSASQVVTSLQRMISNYKELGLDSSKALGWIQNMSKTGTPEYIQQMSIMAAMTGKTRDELRKMQETDPGNFLAQRNKALVKSLSEVYSPEVLFKSFQSLDSNQKDSIEFLTTRFADKLKMGNDEALELMGKMREYVVNNGKRGLSTQALMDEFFAKTGQGESKGFQKSVDEANQMLSEIMHELKNVGQALLVEIGLPLMQIIKPALAGVASFLKGFGTFVSEHAGFFKMLGIGITVALGAALAFFAPITATVAAIGFGIAIIIDKWNQFRKGTLDTHTATGAILNLLFKVGSFLVTLASGPLKLLLLAFSGIWQIVKAVWSLIEPLASLIGDQIVANINTMADSFGEVESLVSSVYETFGNIAGFLKEKMGGLVDAIFTNPINLFLDALKITMPMLQPLITAAEKLFGLQLTKSKPGGTSGAVAGKPALAPVPSAGGSGSVLDSIRAASLATGVDANYMMKTAYRESNFNPNAQAGKGSASGLYQFIDSTWLEMMKKYGAQTGVSTEGMTNKALLAMKKDPQINAMMGALLTKENQQMIGSNRQGDSYLAHFLGPDAAKKIIQGMDIRSALGGKYNEAVKNNAFMQGMTSADLREWADKKMATTSSYQQALAQLEGIKDARSAAVASSSVPVKVQIATNDKSAALLEEQNRFLREQEGTRQEEVQFARVRKALNSRDPMEESLEYGGI